MSVSSRTAKSTERVPGLHPNQYRETLSLKTEIKTVRKDKASEDKINDAGTEN